MCTDLLPSNISPQLLPKARLGCERIEALRPDAQKLSDISEALHTDAKYLETLAAEWQTYFLTGDENEAQRRSAIAASSQLHRIKGTVAAIKRALESYRLGLRLIEWFDSGKEPYLFDIEVSLYDADDRIDIKWIEGLRGLIDEMKSVRSHLDNIIIKLGDGSLPVDMWVAGIERAKLQTSMELTDQTVYSVGVSGKYLAEISTPLVLSSHTQITSGCAAVMHI